MKLPRLSRLLFSSLGCFVYKNKPRSYIKATRNKLNRHSVATQGKKQNEKKNDSPLNFLRHRTPSGTNRLYVDSSRLPFEHSVYFKLTMK